MKVFLILSLLLASLIPVHAHAEHEGEAWVRNRLIAEIRGRVQSLANAGSLSRTELTKLDDLWFSLNDRAAGIRKWRFEGLSYSYELLRDLEMNEIPALAQLLARLGHEPSRTGFEARQAVALEKVRTAEALLRERMATLPARATRKLLALAAFARSGTLGAGKIGSWNPASSKAIQTSAVDGLTQVLSNVDRLGDRPVDLDFFRRQQSLLLGAAQHHFSRAGEIMDRDLTRGDGTRQRFLPFAERWVNDLALTPRSSADALEAYARLLHLHPFGDSNGRVAEVAKQLLLNRMDLPPLLTPEKTSIETYRDSVGWGQTNFAASVLEELQQTLAFLEPLSSLQQQGWHLASASLAGSVLVCEFGSSDGRRAVAVIPRALEAMGDLPPAPGAFVLASTTAQELRLHLEIDGSGRWTDLAPLAVTPAPREGDLQVSYPLYFHELASRERGDIRFALHYQHANGNEVWFNNDGRDYFHSFCRGALE